MQSFIAQGGVLANVLAPAKDSSKGSSATTDKSANKDSSKDFVSILFEQIKNSAKKSISTEIKNSSNIEKSKISTTIDDKSKSASELLLSEILNIISLLKSDNKQMSFPKFTDKLQAVLHKNTTTDRNTLLNDLKNVKDVNDLIKLSKKYDLGLENIKLTKQKVIDIQKEFPKLDIKQFFKLTESNDNQRTDTKTVPQIEQNNVKSSKTTLNEHIIKNLNNKDTQNLAKDTSTTTLIQSIHNLKKNTKLPDTTAKISDVQDSSKNVLQSLLSNIDKNTKKVVANNTEEDKKNKIGKQSTNDIKGKDLKIQDIESQIQQKNSIDKKTVLKDEKAKKDISAIKTNKDNVKIDNLQTKQDLSTLTKNHIKKDVQPKISTINEANIQQKSTKTLHENSAKKNSDPNNNLSSVHHKLDMKNHALQDTAKADKNIPFKNSLNQFATDLKEKIDNYKPPIMKVQLSLNPKNLGSVDVVLLHRGNNLHVNITSNTNTMSLFTQNQAEFKNSLVNMGFTNLEMNFSDQNQGQSQNNQQQNRQDSGNQFENIQNQNSYDSTVELIVPQYV
ncbi:MAG: flagellar hook-length control protein FliK [Sulfurospirillaceae bacterium]|nr:flagellar hook-length control protein FliK [Sulfurospirillaceae bacterium]